MICGQRATIGGRSPTVVRVDWEHLFDDLEGQLAAEWESERAALEVESERLRISKLTLHERLSIVVKATPRLRVHLPGGDSWITTLHAVGADWIGVRADADARLRLIPLTAVEAVEMDHGTLLAGLAAPAGADGGLRARMGFGFVLRDLARRRVPVTLARRGVVPQHGTIDRAAADHLDLALHEQDEPRRVHGVRGFCSIPFHAVSWVRLEEPASVI